MMMVCVSGEFPRLNLFMYTNVQAFPCLLFSQLTSWLSTRYILYTLGRINETTKRKYEKRFRCYEDAPLFELYVRYSHPFSLSVVTKPAGNPRSCQLWRPTPYTHMCLCSVSNKSCSSHKDFEKQ